LDAVYNILGIIGAVGLFIFGMKIMSESIQRLAGNAMRSFLDKFVSNTSRGIFTGFITTSFIQSSSAATVMIVSFANAGIFTLRQAIALTMGANIGTTITAWLFLVFGFTKLGVSGYMFILLALATPLIFVKNSKYKNIGEAVMGFCIMFLGLGQLKKIFIDLDLQNNIEFLTFLSNLSEMGYISILLFLFLGTMLSIIVQSSTVAMGFTLAFCISGLPLEMGAALVLGENLGTTATANIAALVANVHGKRAARFHTLFNLIGIIWALLLYYPILYFIDKILIATPFGSPLDNDNTNAIAAALAVFHTLFNLVNVLLLSSFIPYLEKLSIKISPKSTPKDTLFKLEYMEQGITSASTLYILKAKKQIIRFAIVIKKMSDHNQRLIFEPDPNEDSSSFRSLSHFEFTTKKVESEVSNYLAKLTKNDLTEELSNKVRSLLMIVSYLESIGDLLMKMAQVIDLKKTEKIWFTSEQRNELKTIYSKLDENLELMLRNLNKKAGEVELTEALELNNQMHELRARYKKETNNNILKNKDINLKSLMTIQELMLLCEEISDLTYKISESAFLKKQ
jgi:phosphate:Na+ symporter